VLFFSVDFSIFLFSSLGHPGQFFTGCYLDFVLQFPLLCKTNAIQGNIGFKSYYTLLEIPYGPGYQCVASINLITDFIMLAASASWILVMHVLFTVYCA